MFKRLIYLYRLVFNPIMKPCCRFYPSCSHYAVDSLREYGFFKSIPKITWRILRCNPFNSGGYDPVIHARGEGE